MTCGVYVPSLIRVLNGFDLDTCLTQRTYDHVIRIEITRQHTIMCLRFGMLSAKDLLAAETFERQVFLLVTHFELTVLAYMPEFHLLYALLIKINY